MLGRMLFSSVLVALCLHVWLATSADPALADELTPKAIYQQTLRGTAWLVAPKGKTAADVGTAWVVSRSRKLLITSFHVVGPRDTVLLLFPSYDGKRLVTERDFYLKRLNDGDYLRGTLLDVDPKRDLALIEAEALPARTTELKLATAAPDPGDRLHAVGNPVESKGQWLYLTGTVRQVYRTRDEVRGPGATVALDARVVETQLPMNPGDSGGPVVNGRGALVGIATSLREKAPSLTWCVAAEEVQAFLKDFERTLKARTAEELNQRGARSFRKGLWARAVADFTAAVRLDPEQALFYQNRAWAFHRQGNSSRAIADFTKALALKPKDATLYNERGYAHLNGDKLTEALADFDAAIRINPKYALAYNNRGFTRCKKGDYAGATTDYSVALALDPKNADVYNNRGLAYLEQDNHAKAIADFTEAIRLQPRFAAAYFNRGRAYAANNAPARAKTDRDKAVELDPSLAKK
jgi:Tfp pilus assembly protein PilF